MNQNTYSEMSLTQIADTLAGLYTYRAEAGLAEWQAERDIERRRLEITPADIKSLGANEAERKTALERIFAADPTLGKLVSTVEAKHAEIVRWDAQIAAAEASRRACEWYIRLEMVNALAGKTDRSGYDPTGDAAMDAGFQGMLDEQVEEEIPF